MLAVIRISIHIPTKGMTQMLDESLHHILHFNSHPHKGDDAQFPIPYCNYQISIHIPTKGMTIVVLHCKEHISISIHIPTKGMTFSFVHNWGLSQISIHIPTKGMTWHSREAIKIFGISIHIPTKGMTSQIPVSTFVTFYFNSHPHKGDDW
mgnify:CR=1 FL=1